MRIAVAGATGLVGHHAVRALADAGHAVVPISRSNGIDLLTGVGLEEVLEGVEAVIDATSPGPRPDGSDEEFFRTSVTNLQRAASEQGVGHLVVLSIVGIGPHSEGHPAAKVAHEAAALAGPVPVSIVRATQFHEFPAQSIAWTIDGTSAQVPHSRVQTVAVRTVGETLAEVAQQGVLGDILDLGGPEEADLFVLATRFVERFDLGLRLVPTDDPSPAGSRLPGPGARLAGPTFDDWLTSADADRMVQVVEGARHDA